MFLALKEMRRAKVRFALLMGAIGLLVFLVLFQQSLQNGLITGFVGGIRNQSAPVVVYSVDGRRNLQGGVLLPELDAAVRAVDGVGRTGRLGLSTFTVEADGEQADASVVGYDAEGLGSPAKLVKGRLPSALGEAVASEVDAADGFDVGDVVTLVPGGYTITVVGLAADVQVNVTPTLFATFDTYEAAVRSRFGNADAVLLPNALAIEPAAGVSPAELVQRINAVSDEVDALTRSDAAAKAPGVSQVQTSFRMIFVLYGLVVPFVIGLFFLIVTLQKTGALTLLRAIGASTGKLVAALLIQVLVVVAGGLLIGVALYAPISQAKLGGIRLRFETSAVIVWAVVIVVAGLISSIFSATRVRHIDPVDAVGGAGSH